MTAAEKKEKEKHFLALELLENVLKVLKGPGKLGMFIICKWTGIHT